MFLDRAHSWPVRALPIGICMFGCRAEPHQSALHPAGPAAEAISLLWWVMFVAFSGVLVLVVILTLVAVFRAAPTYATDENSDEGVSARERKIGSRFIIGGGVVLPIAVTTPLLVYSLFTSTSLRTPQAEHTVEVVGRMWWWEVRYPEHKIIDANEIYIPANRPVRLELTSADVIHSFWVPRLHGKRDMIPGVKTIFWIQADRPGIYRGQCAEYCGTQHAKMAFVVIALADEDFDQWIRQRTQARPVPTADHRRGSDVFFSAGCAQCHAIRDTPAKANIGPDLTFVGSRHTLAAGTLPNNRGNLAGWLSNPQALKPGCKMPRTYLSPDDLLALVAYLETMK